MSRYFETLRGLALALLNSPGRFTPNAGRFLGQCAVDPRPLSEALSELSEKQLGWLENLLESNGFPPLSK